MFSTKIPRRTPRTKSAGDFMRRTTQRSRGFGLRRHLLVDQVSRYLYFPASALSLVSARLLLLVFSSTSSCSSCISLPYFGATLSRSPSERNHSGLKAVFLDKEEV